MSKPVLSSDVNQMPLKSEYVVSLINLSVCLNGGKNH